MQNQIIQLAVLKMMPHLHYDLGRRDAVAMILSMVRTSGIEKTILDIADQLLVVDKDHPHAKWVKENIKLNN